MKIKLSKQGVAASVWKALNIFCHRAQLKDQVQQREGMTMHKCNHNFSWILSHFQMMLCDLYKKDCKIAQLQNS